MQALSRLSTRAFQAQPAVTAAHSHRLAPLAATQTPAARFSPGAPENAELRRGRPDWSREWGAAKTGGPNHRRHEVRSGLIRASLQANWNYAKETHQLDKFFDMANRVLEEKTFPVTSEKEADLIIDRLYTRLHNNHMNIFYGRGSYNQMLGTLAHGLEHNENKYFSALDQAGDIRQCHSATLSWLQTVISYAMCEYMDFSAEQEMAVAGAVKLSLNAESLALDADKLKSALDAIKLFEPEARKSDGPMEFSAHREKQAALVETSEILTECVQQAFQGAENSASLMPLRDALKDIAAAFLDSADTDLSESRNDDLRKLQNTRAIEVTHGFSDLVEHPNLEKFENTANRFLALEKEGGELLGIGSDYKKWFAQDGSRERLFDAITSEKMTPTVESARFNPRQWDAPIRNNFKASKHTQRVQVVPSTLVRQVGYTVSNHAFATGQSDKLMRAYERMLGRQENSINSLDDLQRAHALLIRKVHNNPTNIYIGSRAGQIARENVAFALETNQGVLNKALAPQLSDEQFAEKAEAWRTKVVSTAIEGYLALTPMELRVVHESVEKAMTEPDHEKFKDILESDLKSSLELFSKDVRLKGALARYDFHQLDALRNKISQVITLAKPLKARVDELLRDDGLGVTAKQAGLQVLVDRLAHKVTHTPSQAPDADVKAAQNDLLKFVDPLLRLKEEKVHDAASDVIERYEQTLTELLATASIAKEMGLSDWAKGAGSLKFDAPGKKRH